jgi:predicted ATPase
VPKSLDAGAPWCNHDRVAGGARHLPSGNVAFVFTDIEASTKLLRRLGDAYGPVFERHRELLRRAWRANRGHEVSSDGDAFFVAFSAVEEAMAACEQAQRALAVEAWPQGVRLRVRMGLHTGLAAPRNGQYLAVAVHQARRVADVGHGGQILVSEPAVQRLPSGGRPDLIALGRFRVRDFKRPITLYQLSPPGLASKFPGVRALPAERHNLPPAPSRLIGRQADVAMVRRGLATARLLTVVGTGGVGKSRLVTEIGRQMARSQPGGVWWIECGSVEDESLLPAAVATSVGVPDTDDGSLGGWADVLEHLRPRRAMLVFDGCERHRTAVTNLVRSILETCLRVRVLVTSRQPLHLAAERVHRLEPLPIDATPDAQVGPAVELFCERAAAVGVTVSVDGTERAVVEAICRRLDGLPLALEIAAARTEVMQPTEILTGLDARLRLLRSQDVSRPSRLRTLEALLDWSVRLLTPTEVIAFRRLALFGASFDIAAATAVVAAGAVGPADVPEVIWSLTDKSLLIADPVGGATRYRMLETIRTYARELLDRDDDSMAAARRLAGWYSRELGPARTANGGWVGSFGGELDNVRAVLGVVARVDQSLAQELGCAIARYHDAVQSYSSGIVEVGRLVGSLRRPGPARVGLLAAFGDLHVRIGDVAAAQRAGEEADRLRVTAGAPDWDDVGVDKTLGEVAIRSGRPERAIARAERALDRPISLRGRARMYNLLGIALVSSGDQDRAAAAFRAELDAARQLGDEVLLAHAHSNAAELALRTGDGPAAARHQLACMRLAMALGQPGMLAYAFNVASRMAADAGAGSDWVTAVRLIVKAEAVLAETGLVLYDTDAVLADELLRTARRRLGDARYLAEREAGLELALTDAIVIAERVLGLVIRERPVAAHTKGSPE